MSDALYQHSDSSGFATGFFLGLIVGGAGGYLFSTEKGQELITTLKEHGGEKLKEIVDNPALEDKLKELESTMQQARAVVNQAATQVAERTAPSPPKKSFFQKHGLSLGK